MRKTLLPVLLAVLVLCGCSTTKLVAPILHNAAIALPPKSILNRGPREVVLPLAPTLVEDAQTTWSSLIVREIQPNERKPFSRLATIVTPKRALDFYWTGPSGTDSVRKTLGSPEFYVHSAGVHYSATTNTPRWLEHICGYPSEYGGDPHPLLDPGEQLTPLHYVAATGTVAACRELVASGADVNAQTSHGWTPLHVAATDKNVDVCLFLIKQGAVVNARNRGGVTPLHFAMLGWWNWLDCYYLVLGAESKDKEYGDVPTEPYRRQLVDWLKVVDALIEAGAYANAQTSTGLTPLDWLVLRAPCCPYYADDLTENAILSLCQRLVSAGSSVDGNPDRRWPPLHNAVRLRDKRVATYLVSKGASVTAKTMSGRTPLHEAARFGQRETCKMLVAAGADTMAVDDLGKNPLHEAAWSGNADICRLLAETGADIHARDKKGWTPLHYCISQELRISQQTLAFLITEGADINARDNGGKTPLTLAMEAGERTRGVVEFLRKHGAKN